MQYGRFRGSFPRLPRGQTETPQEQRLRYEQWLISTREQIDQGIYPGAAAEPPPLSELVACSFEEALDKDATNLDPEYDAVMYQPNNRGDVTRPSRKLAVRAKCWQCVSGDDEPGGAERIRACTIKRCCLHPQRPYKLDGEKVTRVGRSQIDIKGAGFSPLDHAAKAQANPGNLVLAVKGFCSQCCGGRADMAAVREVRACTTATCGLWMVRPGATAPKNADPAIEDEDAGADDGDA
jgi:hypothetical protein